LQLQEQRIITSHHHRTGEYPGRAANSFEDYDDDDDRYDNNNNNDHDNNDQDLTEDFTDPELVHLIKLQLRAENRSSTRPSKTNPTMTVPSLRGGGQLNSREESLRERTSPNKDTDTDKQQSRVEGKHKQNKQHKQIEAGMNQLEDGHIEGLLLPEDDPLLSSQDEQADDDHTRESYHLRQRTPYAASPRYYSRLGYVDQRHNKSPEAINASTMDEQSAVESSHAPDDEDYLPPIDDAHEVREDSTGQAEVNPPTIKYHCPVRSEPFPHCGFDSQGRSYAAQGRTPLGWYKSSQGCYHEPSPESLYCGPECQKLEAIIELNETHIDRDDDDDDDDDDSEDESSLDKDSSTSRFIDSGWGGECLQETEDIDFEFVYALHTFVATVDGQANATKGDTMVLLDDSNSYWWLVRIVKDATIGKI